MKLKYPITEPGANVHPEDVYNAEEHERNLALATDYLERFAIPDTIAEFPVTPWMLSMGGIARVQETKKGIKAEFLEERAEGYWGLAAHFVKNTVLLGEDYVQTQGKLYPPYHYKFTRFFGYPISPGMLMGYRTGADNPRGVIVSIERHLNRAESQDAEQQTEGLIPEETIEKVKELSANPYNVIDIFRAKRLQQLNLNHATTQRPAYEGRGRRVDIPATLNNVTGIFRDHPIRLRRWAKVILPKE